MCLSNCHFKKTVTVFSLRPQETKAPSEVQKEYLVFWFIGQT